MDKSIYELDLGQSIPDNTDLAYKPYHIHRVPGGWIYEFVRSSVFVPFNNEFQKVTKEDHERWDSHDGIIRP